MKEIDNMRAAAIRAEYEVIVDALKKVNFNKTLAAKYLKIDRRTFYRKLKMHKQLQEQEGK